MRLRNEMAIKRAQEIESKLKKEREDSIERKKLKSYEHEAKLQARLNQKHSEQVNA